MRKSIMFMMFIISILFLSSCSVGSKIIETINEPSDSEKAENRLKQIIDAINKKDKNAIKVMFSEQARSEANDLDKQIDYLFTLFPNKIDSWKQIGGQVGESRNEDYRDKSSSYSYKLYAGGKQYLFSMLEYLINTDKPEEIDLYTMLAVNEKDADYAYFSDAGIYTTYLDEEKVDAFLEQICNAIKSKDRDAIIEMFSNDLLSEIEDMNGGIDYLFHLFPNGIDSWKQISGYTDRSRPGSAVMNYVYKFYANGEEYWFDFRGLLESEIHPETEGFIYIITFNINDGELWTPNGAVGIFGTDE